MTMIEPSATPADPSLETPAGPSDPVADIVVTGLTRSYGSRAVLRGVDLTVRRGEVFGLLGPNGAGKTTLVEILEGFRHADGGEVRVLGRDPGRAGDAWRAELGIVLQAWRDHARWLVDELLEVTARHYRPFRTPDRPRPLPLDEVVDIAGLGDYRRVAMGRLSGGQRRRVDVALALVGNPTLLFMDEPTTGFDPEARHEFHDLIRRLARELHTTVFMTTHDLDEAEHVADRIAILAEGRLPVTATPTALRASYAGRTEVRWRVGHAMHSECTDDAESFTRALFDRYPGQVSDLELRRPSLEDAYLSIVGSLRSGADKGA